MITRILISLLIGTFSLTFIHGNDFNSMNNPNELDSIDAYSLKINNIPLFANINSHIDLLGLPNQLLRQGRAIEFNSIEDLLAELKSSRDFAVVNFSGIEFWCFSDLESIPCKIDFRKLEKKITNGNIVFSDDYKLNDFKKHYPNSFANNPQMPQSFFAMSTQEQIDGLKHYFVQRFTKSNPDIKLLVEFTFKDDKLIYMFFANF